MNAPPIRFDDFEFDARNATLRKAGAAIKLRPQAFKILSLLVGNPGQLVTREQIQRDVWGTETFVDFNQGLNVCIRQIREALGDDPETPRYVETVPKLGYRFIAPPLAAPVATAVVTASAAGVLPPAPAPPASIPPAPRMWLPRSLGAALALILLAVVGVLAWNARGSAGEQPAIRSLAVLPLTNVSTDPDQEFFAEGMTDALITDLAQIRSLKVISRTSVMGYKGPRKSLPEIARELGVDAIVEGSVQRVENRVRINIQLVHGATDHHVWAQTYERNVGDILTLERDVARAVAIAVRAALTPEERSRLTSARSTDPIAYEAYLRGRHFWNERSATGLQTAIKYFNEALARDPNYAQAYAGLADCYVLGPGLRMNATEAYSKARAAATKALELDESLAEAHSALGLVQLFFDWNLTAAGEHFRRAIDLNPGYATARQMHAEYLSITGHLDEALAEIRRARDLDPLSLIIRRDVGRVLYFAHRYDEAIVELLKTLETDPNFNPALFLLAFAYERVGKHDEALARFERLEQSSGGRALMKGALGYMHGIAGRQADARRMLNELIEGAGPRPPSYDVALVHLGLGDRDRVFDWLNRAVEERSYRVVYLAVETIFDPLRSDPRFVDLLQRAGVRSTSTTH